MIPSARSYVCQSGPFTMSTYGIHAGDVRLVESAITTFLSPFLRDIFEAYASKFVATPTAESTTSVSILISPSGVFTVATQLRLRCLLRYFTIHINFHPCFLEGLVKYLDTSSSSTGTIRGRNSTMVTSTPMVYRNMQTRRRSHRSQHIDIFFGSLSSTIASR